MLEELNNYVQKNEIQRFHNTIYKDKHKMGKN